MGITFSGFEDLLKELESIDNKLQNEIGDEALRAGAKPVLKEQQKLVPVLTGKLKDSLEVGKIKKAKGNKKINIGIGEKDYETCRYGFYINQGSRTRTGKFFLQKSIKNAQDEAVQVMAEIIAKRIGN